MANSKSKSNNKSNGKSNKTAHVLNLLTEPGEAGESAAQPKQHPAAQQPPADNSQEVAESIRSALEEDLLAELEEEPAPVQEPKPEPAPTPIIPEPEPEPPAPEPQPEPAPAPIPGPEPVPAPPAPAAPAPAEEPKEPGITYLNVMQALVEDKVDKYMERFHMCTCDRCRTDVVALTLTSLPAKYIVVPEAEGVPMLSIYEGRYNAAVTAQLMWACQKVSEHPRHTPGDDGQMRLGAPRREDDTIYELLGTNPEEG